jgi:hypothetical protein
VEVSIRNLVPDYLEFERQVRGHRGDLRVLWQEKYAFRHRDVFDAYFELGEPDDFVETIESPHPLEGVVVWQAFARLRAGLRLLAAAHAV